jgi:uncharacterized protein YcaQ
MRRRGTEARWATFAAAHPALLHEVQEILRERGPLGNRDFSGRTQVSNYRGRNDSALALYYLWLTGTLLTHHRRNFERIYDFREHIAPPALDYAASVTEAEDFFADQATRGLSSARWWAGRFAGLIERRIARDEAQERFTALVTAGAIIPVQVEGWKDMCYVPAADAPLLADLVADRVPDAWQPLGPTTLDEVVFLAPLEKVSARGRAALLFDFDYIWEVYKPAAARRWGYYTLPILYGDTLVARLDPQLDRATGTLHILGFWLEPTLSPANPAFAAALGRGLARFARFHAARQIDLAVIQPATLRAQVAAAQTLPLQPF